MNKWVSETLLPSLYEQYLSRNPKHVGIIVSDKVNQILLGNMTPDYRWGVWKTIVVGSSLYWRGRRVSLQNHGRYHILTFGLTDDERDAVAEAERAKQLAKEIERAKTAARRSNPDEIARRIERAQRSADGYKDYLDDPESTPDEIIWATTMLQHYSTIIAILHCNQ